MIPPTAFSAGTAISVVGVVARPMLTTSKPNPIRVPQTQWLTISPEMRASRPTTIFFCTFPPTFAARSVAYAVTDFTMSSGLSVSPVWPPMVPRKPEIDFMSVIYFELGFSFLDRQHKVKKVQKKLQEVFLRNEAYRWQFSARISGFLRRIGDYFPSGE